MRVVVIGATGHIGTYLVPRLVERGLDVVAVSRGRRRPYREHPAFDSAELLIVDREFEEARGTFGPRIASLGADAVVDLTCFTPASAARLIDCLRGSPTLLLHCGSIWVHGPARTVPVSEELTRRPMEPYGAAKRDLRRRRLALRQLVLAVFAAEDDAVAGVARNRRQPCAGLADEVLVGIDELKER